MGIFLTEVRCLRESFGKCDSESFIPDLVSIQLASYGLFLQQEISYETRKNKGIHEVLLSIFPITNSDETATVEYVDYFLGEPKYGVDECRKRGMTYNIALRVKLRLIIWDKEENEAGEISREVKSVKEQEVFFCDVPLMTCDGTFVINGTDRVVVSQMHRSPGVFFDHDRGKMVASGKVLYSARVIPYRGSWLDFEFDSKDYLYFRIDRRRKLYLSSLFYALGYDKKKIYDTFYDSYKVSYGKGSGLWNVPFNINDLRGKVFDFDLLSEDGKDILIEAGKSINIALLRRMQRKGVKNILVQSSYLLNKYLAEYVSIVGYDSEQIGFDFGTRLTEESLEAILNFGINELSLFDIDDDTAYIKNTIAVDKNSTQESALNDIYKVMRPGEPVVLDSVRELFNGLFFDNKRYDLSAVGRMKLNARIEDLDDSDSRVLSEHDIVAIVNTLIKIKNGEDTVDDIDHLSNRRVRSVGELIENQFRIGVVRMEKVIREGINTVDLDSVMPSDLINSKLLSTVIKDFFATSQLSQFMDQTNPLSELTHKRRISALGPGGLTRDRAGFEVRDVHSSHYSRICPIETPEGHNIGLINSLAIYSHVNEYGFIESLYRKVENGKVSDETVYLTAIEEDKYVIAQANATLDNENKFVHALVNCRQNGEFVQLSSSTVDYIDLSPKQLFSVGTSLIPFLENDDANRALMGANMQRQAVPLLRADRPLVGSGMESVIAKGAGICVIAKNAGCVTHVDSRRIIIKTKQEASDGIHLEFYKLRKYQRSNHDTCINQRPLVSVGQNVNKDDIIADGFCTDSGELALGRNLLVAFMPWNGYNYEDSILISEEVVQEEAFTSIHIEELEIVARDTRLGPEDITRDIPNVSAHALRHIDESGIVHVGANVKAGDILVGKVTPKGETSMTPEEKLLRAIFGEKAAEVKETSLRVPLGMQGVIVDVRIFSRRGVEKDQRSLISEKNQIDVLNRDYQDESNIVANFTYEKLYNLLIGQVFVSGTKSLKEGAVLTKDVLDTIRKEFLWKLKIKDPEINVKITELKQAFDADTAEREAVFKRKIEVVQNAGDLPQGSLKVVKVFMAVKSKLRPGDKMAGRHGNKGVISRILPREDMPYLQDGTPVQIVLNPLGFLLV